MILQWLLDASGSVVLPVAFGVVTTVISLICSRALLARTTTTAEAALGHDELAHARR